MSKNLKTQILDRWKKIYTGQYRYTKMRRHYCTESFEVGKCLDTSSYIFSASQEFSGSNDVSRDMTISMEYIYDHENIPRSVQVIKELDGIRASEKFEIDINNEILNYTFKNNDTTKEIVIEIPRLFYVATPFACTALGHMNLSDTSAEAAHKIYHMVYSDNAWVFSTAPKMRNILVTRLKEQSSYYTSATSKSSNSILYSVTEHFNDQNGDISQDASEQVAGQGPILHISRYANLPYLIDSYENVEIKLHDFSVLE